MAVSCQLINFYAEGVESNLCTARPRGPFRVNQLLKPDTPSGTPSILVVKDDPISRNALVCILARLGHQTTGAATVAEGLAKLEGLSDFGGPAHPRPEPTGRPGHRDPPAHPQ